MMVTGRFQGDTFEDLYIKAMKDQKKLYILTEYEDEMEFDLTRKAFVFEDSESVNTIVLEFLDNVIIFKVPYLSIYPLFLDLVQSIITL